MVWQRYKDIEESYREAMVDIKRYIEGLQRGYSRDRKIYRRAIERLWQRQKDIEKGYREVMLEIERYKEGLQRGYGRDNKR